MMSEYKNILVAVDGSDNAQKGFEEAVKLARNNNSQLHITWIINDAELTYSAYAFSKLFNAEKDYVEKEMLKKIHDALELGVKKCESFIEVGNPKKMIVDYAKVNNIDLIVMGATGKGAIERTLVGSTTTYVVNHASCNVMVVR
ncbi:universal stress protein [Enterococcus dispar]|uniref:universal stress protein n=1 Tax=Enterococcus dispar TaxID=44009 RepID=UPI00288DA933|nr:universal stress protein [Enterococcus dispar]MDT2704816.1 universal stress protein [Enterococcus dispar]